jgi:hypothetical protein
LIALAMGGCGGRANNLLPVEGIVKLDGKPLAGASVIFVPDGTVGQTAFGTARQDGSFRLATSNRDGVSPGEYRVIVGVVQTPDAASGDLIRQEMAARQKAGSPTPPLVPAVYGDFAKSPLRCKVPLADRLVIELHGAGTLDSQLGRRP